MNEPVSAEPAHDTAQNGGEPDSPGQPAGTGDHATGLPGTGDSPDGVPDERPEPLPGYEHL